MKKANGVPRSAAWWVILATGVVLSLTALFMSAAARFSSRPVGSAAISQRKESGSAQLRIRHTERSLSFEPNLGQTDRSVRFLSHSGEQTVFLTPGGATLTLAGKQARNAKPVAAPRQRAIESAALARDFLPPAESEQSTDDAVLTMRVVGANREATVRGLTELPGKSNYYIGSDPKNWRTNVPNYARVEYEDIYPGINLIYYGNQSHLEYDFAIAPGADPGQINLSFDADGQSSYFSPILDHNGDLVVNVDGREVRFQKPVAYQPASQPGAQIPIEAKYVTKGNNEIGFEIGKYDRDKPLVIDPVLQYSTYFGGNQHDQGFGVKLDASGNILMTGATASTNFPLKNAFQTAAGGNLDVFVSKFDPTGTTLIYSTYLAGSNDDLGEGIALDASGDAYVTGWTSSPNFPTKNALQQGLAGTGATNVFLAEFDPSGNLVFSTYYGGTGTDHCYAVAVDSSGVYVAGNTSSTDYPTKNPFQASKLGTERDAFLTKFTTDGSSVFYSTYLGGAGDESEAYSLAVDSSQSPYLAGHTSSTSFPIKNAFQSTNVSTQAAEDFVTKFSPDGQSLVYSTYLGGTGFQSIGGIVVDSAGSAYVAGGTTSADFPLQNPWQAKFAGGYDAYVTKFDPSGSTLVYSTYIGGTNDEFGGAIAIDPLGNAYIAGYVLSTDFPTTANAFQPTSGGNWDGFVAEFNSTGSTLIYSSYLGGSGLDVSDAITVDSSGNAWVTGTEASTNFPVTSNAFQSSYGGGNDDAYLANVGAVRFPLTVSLAGTGKGTVTSTPSGIDCGTTCSGAFAAGGPVTLTASPTAGSEFTGWSGACSGLNTCSVTMNAAQQVTATFAPTNFTLTANPTSLSVQPGSQATSTITVSLKTAGIGSPVQLSCAVAGATSALSCNLNPAAVTPGSSSVTSTLTVAASAMAALQAPREHHRVGFGLYALCLPIAFGVVFIGGIGKRRTRIAICYGVLFLLVALQLACSGSSKMNVTNYTVTTTGASASVQETAQVTVAVP